MQAYRLAVRLVGAARSLGLLARALGLLPALVAPGTLSRVWEKRERAFEIMCGDVRRRLKNNPGRRGGATERE